MTFGELKARLRLQIWPQGEASNLVKSHDATFVDSLIDLQTWVACLQQNNLQRFPQCATLFNCGLTVLDAPRGAIKKLSVIGKANSYSSGTITCSIATTEAVASKAFFDESMVGGTLNFTDGQVFTIAAFVDSTHVTVEPSAASAPIEDETFTVKGSGSNPASDFAPDDYCTEIVYKQVDPCHIHKYLAHGQRLGCCASASWFFGFNYWGCGRYPYPPPTDAGVPAGLPVLPLSYHYPQRSTNSPNGRSLEGIWAIERGRIYVAPWIQSSETILTMWDGLKRVWTDADPIEEDPQLWLAIEEYVRWKDAGRWNKDELEMGRAMAAFNEARSMLIHECHEQTRVRNCEPSQARGATITTLFYNDQQQASASCGEGTTGDPVTVTIPAGTVGSTLSVADANQKAKAAANAQAQAQLVCTPAATVYRSHATGYTAYCTGEEGAPTPTGQPVQVNLPEGEIEDTTSQADVDTRADARAQSLAVGQLQCTYYNKLVSYTAHCAGGDGDGPPVTREVAAGTVPSTVSQQNADDLATTQATNAANEALVCSSGGIFWNTEQAATYGPRTCHCAAQNTTIVVTINVVVADHVRSSVISQADANQKAIQFAQSLAYQYFAVRCNSGDCATGTYTYHIP